MMTPQEALDVPLDLPYRFDDATTLRQIIKRLASKVFEEDEGFDGKRPFGDSLWQYALNRACVRAGILDPEPGAANESFDFDDFIQQCIEAL
jgi:hypothetical protein